MQAAVRGFQDLGQVEAWAENNPSAAHDIQAQAERLESLLPQSAPVQPQVVAPAPTGRGTAVVTPRPIAPAAPDNTLSSTLVGDGQFGQTVGTVTRQSVHGLGALVRDTIKLGGGDPIATVGIGAAMIFAVYKMFKKTGFLKGLGVLFGAGFLNNIQEISKTLDPYTSRADAALSRGASQVATAATGAASTAAAAVAPNKKPSQSSEKKETPPEEAPTQKAVSDTIRKNDDIQKLMTQQQHKKHNGALEDYLKYINTNLKDTKIDLLWTIEDREKNIFYPSRKLHESIILPSNLDPVIFKRIMRMYITGIDMPDKEVNNQKNIGIIKEKLQKIL